MKRSNSVARKAPKQPWAAKKHVALVNRIDNWLVKAGIGPDRVRTEVSIDLVDGLYAAEVVKAELEAMLRCNPKSKKGRDQAALHAITLHVYADGELKYHVQRLLRRW